MNFFAELKRRNVVRVAIAYAVASWVLIQIGDVAAQNFEAPMWVMKMFMTALMAGFPIALFFSWAYEITPEGIKKESEIDHIQSISSETGKKLEYVTIALLVIAIGFIAFDRMSPNSEAAPAKVQAPAGSVINNDQPEVILPDIQNNSIAVLPFVNMSADPDQDYFSDGISEELLNLLVRVDGLDVASRTSSFAYKGENPNIPQIAEDLKVANILEGSVRKAGNRVRITAQLIDTQNDRHLWSETYDRELVDIFAIQDEIANSIVGALRTELGLEVSDDDIEVANATENMDAYDLFLQGHAILISRGNLPEGIRLLERAVELDPNYARAWADMGAMAWVAPGWNYFDRDYLKISESAIKKALELDENQSMAWAVKSYLRHIDKNGRDYNDTLAYLDQALKIDPKNTSAWLWRGLAKSELGYHEAAMKDLERCVQIDSAYQNCRFHLGNTLAIIGDRQGAIKIMSALLREGFPGIIPANVQLLLSAGEPLAAYTMAARIGNHDGFPISEWIDAMEHPDRDYTSAVSKAEAFLEKENRVGVREALMLAFGAYDRLQVNLHYPQTWMWHREYSKYRQSEEFKKYITALNIPAYWREHGFPPQCRPLGAEEFECE